MTNETKSALFTLAKTIVTGIFVFIASLLGAKTGENSLPVVASALAAINFMC